MADKVVSSSELYIEGSYSDGSKRTIVLPNPADNITEQQVKALESTVAKVLCAESSTASLTGFTGAKTRTITTTQFDLA